MKVSEMSDEDLMAAHAQYVAPKETALQKTPVSDMSDSQLKGVYTSMQSRPTPSVPVVPSTNDTFNKHLGNMQNIVPDAFKSSTKDLMEHLPGSNVVPDVFGKELSAYKQGPAAYQKYKDLQDIPAVSPQDIAGMIPIAGGWAPAINKYVTKFPDSRAAIEAGEEIDKLYTGVKHAGNTVSGMAGFKTPLEWLNESKSIDADRAEKDQLNAIRNENSGMPEMIGGSIPYMIDGALIGPKLAKGAEAVISKLAFTPSAAINEGKGVLSRVVNKLASIDNPILDATIGKRLQREVVKPMENAAIGRANRVQGMSPLMAGSGTMVGSAALGGIEGALHPDHTAGEGALSSALGTLIGSAARPWLANSPNMRDKFPHEKDLLDFATRSGYTLTPGLKYGIPKYQRFEAGMKNTNNFAGPLKEVMDGNDIAANRTAYEALGIPRGQVDSMGPEQLTVHLQGLKDNFNRLEASTTGVFDPMDRHVLSAHTTQLERDKTIEGKNIYNDAMDYKRRMDKLMAPNVNTLGQQAPSTVNGKDFADLRSRLKEDISKYYNNGDNSKARALGPFLSTLDKSVERGMGPEHLAEFKKANEQWALANMMMEHGTTPLGRFDPARFGQYALNSDSKRFLTEGAGDNLNTLFKLAKVNYMQTHQAGSDLSGMGIHEHGLNDKATLLQRLLSPSETNPISGLTNLALRAYVNGYPVTTGLLKYASGKNFGDPALYTRAAEEYAQPWPEAYNAVEGQVKGVGDKLTKAQQWLKDNYKEK
jgi:hypothetical protein